MSIVNTGGQAGGAALPFVTGLILDAYNWDAVFLFLAASSLVALLVIAFVVEPIESGEMHARRRADVGSTRECVQKLRQALLRFFKRLRR